MDTENILNKRKIFLITPPKTASEQLFTHFRWTIPHIGLGYIASYISQFGYDVDIFDLPYYPLGEFLKKVGENSPAVIGITATTEEYHAVERILIMIKKINPDIVTVLGGPHATALPEETLADLPLLDFIIRGEGEAAFKELLDEIFGNGRFDKVGSLTYRKNGKIVSNPLRGPIRNLDELPFPAWEKYDLDNYVPFAEKLSVKHRELPIITQRGCPFRCVFCQKTMGYAGVRMRSIDNIMAEIKRDVEEFRINRLSIVDETFSLNKERVIEFCRRMIREGYNRKLTWSCFTRVNLVDEEMIKYMRAAGCTLISFGVESGNPFILKKIKKGITPEQAARAIRLAKKYGIEVHYGIIFGHPFETMETMKDSLRFVLKNRPDMVTFAILVPYPGTEVRKYCETGYGGLKLIARDWRDYHKQMGKALELVQLPRKYLDMFQMYAYARFFLHPKAIRNIFRLVNMRSIPIYFLEKIKAIFSR